ncbi:MAG TPA: response regulator [Thermoanaerobaculia bacterium]|jgi:CheY-like chemotaxis protein
MNAEQHRRVLVVDDDADIRELLVTVLRRRDLVVDVAAGGREAISLLHEHSYSVVLLDLMMPDVDGFAVLESIKLDVAVHPVVLVITAADRVRVDSLDAQRIHGVVRKPFDPLEVAEIVAACAELRGRSKFETMALATMLSSAPLLALLSNSRL